jgi:hypothetical protein
MKKVIVALTLLVACYNEDDARRQVIDQGGVGRIQCIRTGGGHSVLVIECIDAANNLWKCTEDGCMNYGKVQR